MDLVVKAAAATAALPLLVTACSAAGSSSPGSAYGSAVATVAAASSSAANPDAGLLTGVELKGLLEPKSFFPKGFSADPGNSVNTGDTYQQPTAPGKLPCTRLDATSWVDLSGIGPVSFAQDDFIDQTTSQQAAQEIDVYRGTSARVVMAALRKAAGRCPRFTDSQTSSVVTVRLGKGPAVGDDSLSFRLSSPRWLGGTTLVAVRVGTAVITVLFSADSGTGGTQADYLATKLAGKVIQKSQS
jgi:hypothetical protein